jgi:hypothetical protein
MKKWVCFLRAVAGTVLLLAAGCKNDTPSAPDLTGTVRVSGIPQVGETLRADISLLGGYGAVSYQWARGAADIPGGTRETYTLTEDDEGSPVWVQASRAGSARSIRSEPTAAVAPAAAALASIEALQASLERHRGGVSAAAPRPVRLSADLSEADTMTSLFAALKTADKYVSLDLSGCTGLNTWAKYTDAGAEKIVSLVLPNSVTAIAKGTYTYGAATFASFTSLKTLEANGLETVGGYAFYKCAALETVSLPAAATVGGAAFQYCTALETVNLPLAATIEGSAFQYCDALEATNLPAAVTIKLSAFTGCTALRSASLPAAAAIGTWAFRFCYALESLTLGTALPTLDTYVFRDAGRDSGGFTVYVPTAEAKDALNAAIEDTGNSWYKALKVPANISEGKFNGVALAQ